MTYYNIASILDPPSYFHSSRFLATGPGWTLWSRIDLPLTPDLDHYEV